MDPSPASTSSRRPSVIDPISQTLERTRRILFRPFDLGKWFVLGFCAWLASLGQGAGGGGGGIGRRLRDEDMKRQFELVWDWIQAHLGLIVFLAVVVTLVVLALAILLAWLSSRGKLMFLDGVVHDRAAVVEPWARFRTLGNSLFAFRILAGLIAFAVLAVVGTLMVLNLMAMGIGEEELEADDILVLCMWIAPIVLLAFAAGLVGMATNDFIVPIMWLRDCRVMAAWKEFLALLSANGGSFTLYALVKILMAVAIGLLACVATCATCCIAALPYLGVVILLPLYVFPRCYSIEFLAQFGPDYAALARPVPAQGSSPAGGPP